MNRKIGFWVRLLAYLILWWGMTLYAQEEKSSGKKPEEKSDPKAEEMVLQAFKKMFETKGFHFTSTSKTTMTIFEFRSSARREVSTKGIYRPDITYMKVKLTEKNLDKTKRKKEFECFQKGTKLFIKKLPSGDKWEEEEAEELNEIGVLQIERFKWSKEYLKKATFEGKEKINGKEYQIIKISLTPEGVSKILGGEEGPELENGDINNIDFTIKVWVNTETNLPYKFILSARMTSEEAIIKGRYNILFENYNKDIELKIPPEVKKLLEGEKNSSVLLTLKVIVIPCGSRNS